MAHDQNLVPLDQNVLTIGAYSDRLANPAAMGSSESGGASRESSFLDTLAMLRRRKGLLLFGLVVGVGLAYLYYVHATPVYESLVQILVMPKETQVPTAKEVGGERRVLDDRLLQTHAILIQSRRLVKQAVEKRHLETLPSFAGQDGIDVAGLIILQTDVAKGGRPPNRDANVLRVTYRSPHPEDCAPVLNALVESYQDFLSRTFKDTSVEAVNLITQAKHDLENELRADEQAYREFREQSPLVFSGNRQVLNKHQQNLADLSRSLTMVRTQYMETKNRLEYLTRAMENKSIKNVDDLGKLSLLNEKDLQRLNMYVAAWRGKFANDPSTAQMDNMVRVKYDDILKLQMRMKGLANTFGPEHPEMKGAEEQLRMLNDFVQKNSPLNAALQKGTVEPVELLNIMVQSLRHDLVEFETQQRDLERDALSEEAAAKRLATYEIQGETLHDRLVRKTDLFNAVVERLREINLMKDYGGFVTEVITPVEVPNSPVSPKLNLLLALGLFLGGAAGVGLAYLADAADRTFHSPDEVRSTLGLPIMTTIPSFAGRRSKTSLTGQASRIDPLLVAFHRPESFEAETFRNLRTALYFSTYGRRRKVIQVSSPTAGDGKTTMASNLAISIAQSGKKVLLVDGDFRRAKLHKLFGIDPHVGLAQVLIDEAELADAVHTTEIENLWLLPTGPHPSNPSELLSSRRFEEFLAIVREKYDFVIVDTPPILAVSDAAVVAPRVDGVLLTLRITKNGRPQAVRARQILSVLGVQVLGVVVNGLNPDRNYGYGYSGRYYYGDGYYSGGDYDYMVHKVDYEAAPANRTPTPAARS